MEFNKICCTPLWKSIRNNVYIEENSSEYPDFLEEIQTDIDMIVSKEVGSRLLAKIEAGSIPIFISYGKKDEISRIDTEMGRVITITLSRRELQVYLVGKEGLFSCPSFIVLAHELIHAYHLSYGKENIQKVSNLALWGNSEEEYTIQGYFQEDRIKPKITENSIRKEHGLPARFGHRGKRYEKRDSQV